MVVFRGSWVSMMGCGRSLRWFGEWVLQFDIDEFLISVVLIDFGGFLISVVGFVG